ncbi:putative leucine-rich repeat-containing protein DDB_G0290503 isoform X4 [Musca domestica]|uniref:Leucine-rich repeat-containing protein DDB_G0290503 isoform X4 n=1 Tax=Musca domestica TaxID=7370 RepID=A0A1I8NF46_MUSDO|nr:putative leucine-rich repeat-containing protein DDB_G0290503 isoform X4 [Musca domestica]XP_058976985.1 putative leucine-rich repeat-containing protein DDB_G0290503 isoform X4 [Musca domestica]
MMDLHIFIVIACVFLASLLSLLFINKFLRRKTFEEVIAEKKALTEKIYGKEKNVVKKPKKISLKKEMKREKRQQRSREQPEDSDAQSEQQSVEEEPQGLSKTHVEFEPDAEVLTYNNQTASRRSSNAEKENVNKQIKGGKKDKKPSSKGGILVHKNEPANVKENVSAEAAANHFDIKTPKDAVELKKAEKKEEKSQQQQQQQQQQNKKDKSNKKTNASNENLPTVTETPIVKEVKQAEEKIRQNSPKTSQQKQKQQNKKQKDSKDIVAGLEKLSESDTIGVSLLMNLFRRAELNRSEIQILIDYLLNRQQDMPSSHSEWSDDICQKLKRQLEEKEKALAEELEASIGIQAKLRELRTEINTERASMSSTIKSYTEKLATKDQDISLLEQKIKTLNDTLTLERQQFQAKLMHEKQAGSQDIMAQLQMLQKELALKDKCIAELTCMVNASHQAVEESQQKNEIIQTQAQQIRVLEQQRDELEQVSNNRIFDLEKANQLETELSELKLELRNNQNALESARSDLKQSNADVEALRNELALVRTKVIADKQKEIDQLQAQNNELTQQLVNISSKTQEQSKEQNDLQSNLNNLQAQIVEKQRLLDDSEASKMQLQKQLNSLESELKHKSVELEELQKLVEGLKSDVSSKTKVLQQTEQQVQNHQELQKLVETLKSEVQKKDKLLQDNSKQQDVQKIVEALKEDLSKKNDQLKEVEKESEKLSKREKELLQQLQEQKEKNNQQEKLLSSAAKSGKTSASGHTDVAKDQKQLRDLLQRLCPEAVKACAGTALSVTFDQWVEQVLSTHIKQQQQQQQVSSSHKSTQSSNNSHNSPPSLNQNSTHAANGSRSSSSSVSSSPGSGDNNNDTEKSELLKENSILRVRIDELTKLARKTEYTLSDLMQKAEEQEEHWRSVVRSKDEQINTLQYKSNGQQDI